jgi:hypothetical protein
LRLDYTRGPGAEACPDERGMRDAVAARLGYDPVSLAPGPSGPPGQLPGIRVSIARRGGGFVAIVEKRDPTGRVEWTRPPLMDADCRHLVSVLGLSIAIAIDPGALGAPSPVEPPPGPPPPAQPPLPTAERQPSSRPAVRLGVRAGLAVDTVATPTATIAADLGVGGEVWSVSLEGRADLPATAAVDAGARIRTSVLAASLVPCGHWRWFVGCGVVSVGALRAAGTNFDTNKENSGFYAVAGLRVGLEWPLPNLERLALRVSGDGLVTLRSMTAFRSDDGRAVWRTPPVAGLLGAGAVVHF